MFQKFRESKLMGFLGLFTSLGTLLCCALPSALVLLGFGSAVAGVVGEFPQLIWPSEHKVWVFGLSFFMLGLSYLAQRAPLTCPIDQKQDCQRAKVWSKRLFVGSLLINTGGAFYAFILPGLL